MTANKGARKLIKASFAGSTTATEYSDLPNRIRAVNRHIQENTTKHVSD